MARKTITTSDFTKKEVADEEHALVRVLSHPLLSHAIQLDAGALEVAGLKGNTELVEVELLLPNTPPERLVVDLSTFDKLFGKNVSKDDVLNDAEPYYEEQVTTARRRGRPAGSRNKPVAAKPTGSGMSKEQLASIREWLRANGHEVSERGRIKGELLKLWEDAHQGA